MIKLINKLTGTVMWVAEERVEEYLEAGHALASVPCAQPADAPEEKAEPETSTSKVPEEKPAAKKQTAKKTAKAKK